MNHPTEPPEDDLKAKAASMLATLLGNYPEAAGKNAMSAFNTDRLGLGTFIDPRDLVLLGLKKHGIIHFDGDTGQRSISFNAAKAEAFAGKERVTVARQALRR
jgi:hypothetical protein